MNKKFSIIIAMAGLLSFTACHNDLNIEQDSQLSANNMWKEQADAKAAMLGSHARLRTAFNNGLVYWGEYRTGLWGPGTHGGLSQTERDRTYQGTMDNTHTYADWENIYKTINQANLVIRYTPGISFNNDSEKNEVLANALFVRAYSYYWIARIWGDAPLVLEGYESADQELRPNRSSAEDIFKQVEQDINEAARLMPASVTAKKTASIGAIQMLKADYSLWMYKVRNAGDAYLTAAQEAVNAVISSNKYTLQSNYAQIFSSASENGSEVIYAWNYQQEEHIGGYPSDYQFNSATVTPKYHYNPIVVGTGQQWTFYTDAYINVLKANPADKRLATTYQTFSDDGMKQNFAWTNKYKGTWLNSTLVLDSDIILYRLADAYFFDAEIKFYQGNSTQALSSLNKVLERAYGTANYYNNTVNVKDVLVKERMREFPSEGKLWWDFIRLGVVFEMNPHLAGKENQENILLWPISDNSINDNPNLGGQTPGWN